MNSLIFSDEEECPKHSNLLDIPDFRDIYHGFMSRDVSVKTLRASGEDGSYLVRKRINAEEDVDTVEYILSFVHGDEDYHFKMKRERKYFIFANRYFPSFKCLISHYIVSNIISDTHLKFGVVNRTVTAVRESLRDLRCYLSENLSDERMKELLCNGSAGSYLFRPRTDDNDQFVLMFFDGCRIHKLKMDVRIVERCDGERAESVVVLVLGRNHFQSWSELVDNFQMNAIVSVKDANCEDKLVKEVDVNRAVAETDREDIYRKLKFKFNHALQQTDVYSIHGEVAFIDGTRTNWKTAYAQVDQDHGQMILKISKTSSVVIELTRCTFIPIHYSVHQRYCFLLLGRDKNYCVSMMKSNRRENSTEETYAYRQYSLMAHDKEVYHSTEAEKSDDTPLCRAYDRWMMAVKRHCFNTKDDVANEENPERHSKLHRYNRILKLQIAHSGGPEISLTDADLCNISSLNPHSVATVLGQFDVVVSNSHVIATVPRNCTAGIQTIVFQDLPSNINDVSVLIRVKASRRKEFTKELCNYTVTHQELVPWPVASVPLLLSSQTPEQCNLHNSTSYNLMHLGIQADPPSSCCPISVDCYASIEYKQSTILPFNNYAALTKYFMDNLQSIFSNPHFTASLYYALDLPEFKRLLNCFLYMAVWEKKQVEFLFLFFETDLNGTEQSMYFRHNTAANRLFLDYVSQFASDWLAYSFEKLFEEMYLYTDLLKNADPNDEEPGSVDVVKKQYALDEVIYECLSAALSGINDNLHHCPITLRQLFHMIQCEIKRLTPGDDIDGLHYRLLTNLVIFRFFCAVLNSRGERQNDFFRKISEIIRQKNDPRFKDFPKTFAQQESLNDFLVKISRLILSTYAVNKGKFAEEINRILDDRPNEDITKRIGDYRDRTFESLNEELTRPLTRSEKESVVGQLDQESKMIISRLSLSRRFNDALEFLSKLQDEPTYFFKNKLDMAISKYEIISPDLGTIVDDINHKKSCRSTSLPDRF